MNKMLLELGINAKEAENTMRTITTDQKNQVLAAVAGHLVESTDKLLEANAVDVANAKQNHMPEGLVDRLMLSPERIEGMAEGLRQLVALEDPIGEVTGMKKRPNGLLIGQKRVPLGVVGIIYEARPNVSFDVFSLCLKSGNASILKGGSDADASNRAIVQLIHEVLEEFGIDSHVVELLPSTREATEALLHAEGWVDLIIPRGSSNLIQYVRHEATVPVIETGAGICHTYFDKAGDLTKGAAIVNNPKTRRVSVCNAMDCLLLHRGRLADLPALCAPLAESRVILYADEPAYQALEGNYPAELLQLATLGSYGTEFLDYKMAIKTVDDIAEAVTHIYTYGSGHSECIVTEDKEAAAFFTRAVDAACVYVNAPTSFTDGAQFGLGAEIGISTQKLHARGPMGLREMTTYKWIVEGDGQVRKK